MLKLYKAPIVGQFAIESILFIQGIHTADATAIAMFATTAIDRVLGILD
ncbi:MAG: hypothetical protein ACRC62_34940 [Microcoleus sp.]